MAPAGFTSFAVIDDPDPDVLTVLTFAKADKPEEHEGREVAISAVTRGPRGSILRTWRCSAADFEKVMKDYPITAAPIKRKGKGTHGAPGNSDRTGDDPSGG